MYESNSLTNGASHSLPVEFVLCMGVKAPDIWH